MNILPKKSWHVRTKKNIERVRQDEAKAEELAKLEEERSLIAEQEARINQLRNRLGIATTSSTKGDDVNTQDLAGDDGHINLFNSAKDHQTSTNEEHEFEKRREEILWQSKVGILNRLGGQTTANVANPWYVRSHESRIGIEANAMDGTSRVSINERNNNKSRDIQSIHDPLIIMRSAQRIIKDNKSHQPRRLLTDNSEQSKQASVHQPDTEDLDILIIHSSTSINKPSDNQLSKKIKSSSSSSSINSSRSKSKSKSSRKSESSPPDRRNKRKKSKRSKHHKKCKHKKKEKKKKSKKSSSCRD